MSFSLSALSQRTVRHYSSRIILDTIPAMDARWDQWLLNAKKSKNARYLASADAIGIASSAKNHILSGTIQLNITTSPSTCGGSNAGIFADPSGGMPPYIYSLDGGAGQNSGVFFRVAGIHTLTVRDATGQSITTTVTTTNNGPHIGLNVVGSVNQSGCALKDASVTLQGVDGTPPYSYGMDLENWQTNPTFSNLPGGNYFFYVKDAAGCTKAVWSPLKTCVAMSMANRDPSCGKQDGELNMVAIGGQPPYLYSMDGINWQNTGVFTGLGPGLQILQIKDSRGVLMYYGYFLMNYCQLMLAADELDGTCGNSDGTVTATATNGQPPYQYTIDGIHYQNNNVFTGLTPGSYTIGVKDASGTTQWLDLIVGNACPTVTAIVTQAGCGSSDGIIVITGNGGTTPYSYSIDGINFQSSNIFPGLAAGNYTVSLKDKNGKPAQTTVTVNTGCPHFLSVALSATDEICSKKNGTISITATGGTPPYQYSLDGTNFQDEPVFSQLAAGNYTVTAKDRLENPGKNSIVITNLGAPQMQVKSMASSCSGDDGSLIVTASGGSAPYQYSIDGINYIGTAEFDHLGSGSYITYVQDARGCIAQQSTAVLLNNTLTVNGGPDLSICEGSSQTIEASSNGDSFSWEPGSGLDNPVLLQPKASPATTQIYFLTAVKGICRRTVSVTVNVTPAPKIFIGNDTSVLAGQPVPLHISDLGNSGFIQFAWSPVEGLNNPVSSDPVAVLQHDITYKATAWTNGDCPAVGSISIKVFSVSDIFVPNAFTPNGDGRNDILRAIPVGIREFKYFTVYSRLGQRLFYTADPGKGWTGVINGKPELTGTYVWIAAGIDYRGQLIERKGTVVLIR